jgi:sulfite exporter TauE/SafE
MDFALVVSALLLGLAGVPHCAAMCGAACVAVGAAAGSGPTIAFQLARLASYAAVGAVAAASVSTLGRLGEITPVLKPVWIAVQVAALGLGLFLLWRGVQPRWVSELSVLGGLRADSASAQTITWSPARRSARAGLAGLAWAAWPCGLLQSALVVAALANHAAAGAAVMAAFALSSSPGLLAGPWLLRSAARLGRDGDVMQRWLTRAAGVLLVTASAWALGHGLWQRFAAWCFA